MFDYGDIHHFDSADLDRHITGNYGEDQFIDYGYGDCEICEAQYTDEDPGYAMHKPTQQGEKATTIYCHFDCGTKEGLVLQKRD